MGTNISYECLICYKKLLKRPCEAKEIDRRGGRVFCSRKCTTIARQEGGLIREQTRQTCIERYGVDNPGKSADVQAKRERTTMIRYGVKHHWQVHEIRNKTNWNLRNKRGHETMKIRGTYGKSKIENMYFEHLCFVYGVENVERQVQPCETHWPIDFYVKSIDTYIQFDGVYWHGLDRPIEIIAEHRTLRDAQIHKKWLIDRKQDAWFAEHKLKFIRVTDKQFLRKRGFIK